MTSTTTQGVLDFWFGAPQAPEHGQRRAAWFRKDDAFDAEIRKQFGGLIEQALAEAAPLKPTPLEQLARILVLDQFTRNAFRGTARAFAGDAQALALARTVVDTGADRALTPLQRMFVYLPFEHAESLAEQDRAVALMAQLAQADSALADILDYAHRHRDIILRFGRFPHRNAALGRTSTAEEAEFLTQPGSGF